MANTRKPSILVLNGPNLNMLGRREPDVYGTIGLDEIEEMTRTQAVSRGLDVTFRQSNHEGELIDWIQAAPGDHDVIVINAAGLTHTSIALFDALKLAGLPVIEVHLSNIYRREAFRQNSYISRIAHGVICGFGATGYRLAIEAAADILAP